ncbi:hypothetical protein BOTBODRAFT_58280 [Botryobasidium botryosum FD-172 SS1]|uniref:Uncharacterized protein n=1 Tax=Botryobasidium botryosum (strain FD-172 SS1) TaxID=930990 RepID=A0A067MEP5_BOTB1|nr:hypothetical protein BOTBODRAFT_58280 [Botryobasidium botryosum FD-172 SS1]
MPVVVVDTRAAESAEMKREANLANITATHPYPHLHSRPFPHTKPNPSSNPGFFIDIMTILVTIITAGVNTINTRIV